MGDEEYADFCQAIHDPTTIHTMLEDYRAGLTIDRAHEEADRHCRRKIRCPVLCLWSARDDLGQLYDDIPGIWRNWAHNVCGKSINSGHHMAEDAPEELAAELMQFFSTSSVIRKE